MEKRIIEITCCRGCPHYHFFVPALGGTVGDCRRNCSAIDLPNGRLVEDILTIPDWCPLSKASQQPLKPTQSKPPASE